MSSDKRSFALYGIRSLSGTAGTGTDLADNETPVISGDYAADGSVTLAAGDNKTPVSLVNFAHPAI